jgi:hypothetical protein
MITDSPLPNRRLATVRPAHLADTMRRLSKQYPAMRIDVAAMSEIESDERKAIGEDLATISLIELRLPDPRRWLVHSRSAK